MVGGIAITILATVVRTISGGNSIIIGLFTVVAVIAFFVLYLRVISQLFIVELPLAIEKNVTATSAISRSWELTKGSVARILLIVFVSGLATLPVSIVVQIVSTIIQVVLGTVLGAESSLFVLISSLLVLGVALLSAAIVLPFTQAIKAIIYYDLRSRKEGLGLQIRDSKS